MECLHVRLKYDWFISAKRVLWTPSRCVTECLYEGSAAGERASARRGERDVGSSVGEGSQGRGRGKVSILSGHLKTRGGWMADWTRGCINQSRVACTWRRGHRRVIESVCALGSGSLFLLISRIGVSLKAISVCLIILWDIRLYDLSALNISPCILHLCLETSLYM